MRTPTPPDGEAKVERADDDPSATRTPTPKPTPRPAQRRNPADDVIESGEIVERRSLVIRSKSPVVVDDEPTEISVTPFPAPFPAPIPTAPSRSWRLRWLVAAIVCGAAAAALFVLARPAAGKSAALDARAAMIGTTLDGEVRATQVKVEAIAKSPMLRTAIDTDANTLADMARDNDVVFPIQRGEVIEVFQVSGGTRTLLLRLPAGAPELPRVPAGGARVVSKNRAVAIIANTVVEKQRAEVNGEIVLSTPVDLGPIAKDLSQHTTAAVVQGLDEPIVLVEGKTAPNHTVAIPLRSVPTQLSLATVVPQPTADLSYVWACAGAAVLLLVIFVISSLRARR